MKLNFYNRSKLHYVDFRPLVNKSSAMFRNNSLLLHFILFAVVIFSSCQKSGDSVQQPASSWKVDSIISGNTSLHFIYDSQGRVIEDRYQIGDTMEERNTYQYSGSDSMPFTKKRFTRQELNPSTVSYFQYNSKKQKIYDSTAFSDGTTYKTFRISYYATNRIGIISDMSAAPTPATRFHNWDADTIFLNSAGNIDSINVYTGLSQSIYGAWRFWYTEKYSSYDVLHPNVFTTLSTSQANFFTLSRSGSGRWGMHFYHLINNFSSNFAAGWFLAYSPGTTSAFTQKRYTYNSANLPVKMEFIDPSGSLLAETRIIYK